MTRRIQLPRSLLNTARNIYLYIQSVACSWSDKIGVSEATHTYSTQGLPRLPLLFGATSLEGGAKY